MGIEVDDHPRGLQFSKRPHKAIFPSPINAQAREVDLPWCQPKPGHQDVRAPDLIREIMAHPNYLQADEDVVFLGKPMSRLSQYDAAVDGILDVQA